MGDTGSAAFYRPYTPKGSNHWINEIFHADWTNPSNPKKTGTSATDPSKISAALTPYYSSLFAEKPSINPERPLATLESGNKVLPTTAAKCGAPISAGEIQDTCDMLPTGKSPGPDLIPNAFYRIFSAKVTPILERVYAESKQRGALPKGCSDGLISVLYKKRREPTRETTAPSHSSTETIKL